ncbi:hypothetical protein NDA18_000863 [Ustilago nuda]|nr:hypothetical protein NDA18_000863 [Ustilago nuda]
MSDSAVQGSKSRSDSRPVERDEGVSSSSRRESSSKHGNRHSRDREVEHQQRRSHSHRDDRDRDRHRDGRSNRHRGRGTNGTSGSRRHKEDADDRRRSNSYLKRHRDGEDRDARKSSRHRDDRERASRYRQDDQSHRHSCSSKHRHREERTPRGGSSRDHRRSRSRSPLPLASSSTSRLPSPPRSRRSPHSPAPPAEEEEEETAEDGDAPNFAPSGLLAAESNTVNGVVLKYHEPPEARKPKSPWRLYCFKDGKEQQVLHLASQSAYLLGRDRTVVDIPLDHESCSKQHAVLQFRQTITTNEFGDKKKRIQPFLIDLESSNGSYVNENEIPISRYYQLRTGDTLTFGASTREYVLLDESSA